MAPVAHPATPASGEPPVALIVPPVDAPPIDEPPVDAPPSSPAVPPAMRVIAPPIELDAPPVDGSPPDPGTGPLSVVSLASVIAAAVVNDSPPQPTSKMKNSIDERITCLSWSVRDLWRFLPSSATPRTQVSVQIVRARNLSGTGVCRRTTDVR